MAISDIYTDSELNAIVRQSSLAARSSGMRSKPRGDGLRLRLSKIPGVTVGDAARVLEHPYLFQCPPLDEFSVPTTRNVGTYTTYKGDEHTTRGGMAARPLTFRTLAVEWGSFVMEYDFDVEGLVTDLERLVEAGYPIDVLATHQYNGVPEHHQQMWLTSVVKVENAGETDARYLDLNFAQWRDPTTRRRGHSSLGLSLPFTIVLRKDGSYHVLDPKAKSGRRAAPFKGDLTFALIAKSVYGRASWAVDVARAQRPPVRNWGMHTPLRDNPRCRKGPWKIVVPEMATVAGDTQVVHPEGLLPGR